MTTPTQEAQRLEPCPFCGAEPIEHAIEPHSHALSIGGWTMPDHEGSHVIECGCGAGLIDATRAAVVERWNARALASAQQAGPVGKWEGAEEWMPLAWALCAEECGEDACTELVWEGGPIPEPWGDRWLKYEDKAKEMIALVRKHVPEPREVQPLTDEQSLRAVINTSDSLNITRVHELGGKTRTICEEAGLLEIARAIERACATAWGVKLAGQDGGEV